MQDQSASPILAQLEMIPSPIAEPVICYRNLLRWQVQVLKIMNTDIRAKVTSITDPDSENGLLPIPGLSELVHLLAKKIYIIHDENGKTGKTTFINAIKYENPPRFIILKSVPSEEEWKENIQKLKNEKIWTGGCIILETDHLSSSTIDLFDWISSDSDCRGIWIFVRHLPKQSACKMDNWTTFKIRADFTQGIMSNLIPSSLPEVS